MERFCNSSFQRNGSQEGDTMIEGNVGIKLVKVIAILCFALYNHILLGKILIICWPEQN